MIIRFFNIALFLMLLPLFAQAEESRQEEKLFELFVYHPPTCGCCKKWISHIGDESIGAHLKDYSSLSFIKNKYDIKPNYCSCHTAMTKNGFAFEGHVPAKFIKQFLSENHADAIGLSVPAIPVGSPEMEVDERFMPNKILILLKDGSCNVYAEVNTYKEQF